MATQLVSQISYANNTYELKDKNLTLRVDGLDAIVGNAELAVDGTLTEHINKLYADINEANVNIGTLNTSVGTLNASIDKLNTDIGEWDLTAGSMTEKIGQLDSDIDT